MVDVQPLEPARFCQRHESAVDPAVESTGAIIALAVLVPLVAGHFDLSAGFQFGLAQSVAAVLITHHNVNPLVVVVVVLATGIGIGVINGQLITRLHLPSFTTTLATGLIVLGSTEWVTANQIITGVAPTWFLNLGRGSALGIPLLFWYMAVVAIVLFVLLELTVWGRKGVRRRRESHRSRGSQV